MPYCTIVQGWKKCLEALSFIGTGTVSDLYWIFPKLQRFFDKTMVYLNFTLCYIQLKYPSRQSQKHPSRIILFTYYLHMRKLWTPSTPNKNLVYIATTLTTLTAQQKTQTLVVIIYHIASFLAKNFASFEHLYRKIQKQMIWKPYQRA